MLLPPQSESKSPTEEDEGEVVDGGCLERPLESQGTSMWVSGSLGFLFTVHSLKDLVKSTHLPPAPR